jgi:hypothetical protein
MVVDAFGKWESSAKEVINTVASRLAARNRSDINTTLRHYYQKLSVVLMKSNTRAVLSRVPVVDFERTKVLPPRSPKLAAPKAVSFHSKPSPSFSHSVSPRPVKTNVSISLTHPSPVSSDNVDLNALSEPFVPSIPVVIPSINSTSVDLIFAESENIICEINSTVVDLTDVLSNETPVSTVSKSIAESNNSICVDIENVVSVSSSQVVSPVTVDPATVYCWPKSVKGNKSSAPLVSNTHLMNK